MDENDIENVRALIQMLKDAGVTRFKGHGLELELGGGRRSAMIGGIPLVPREEVEQDHKKAAEMARVAEENTKYAASGIVPPNLRELRSKKDAG